MKRDERKVPIQNTDRRRGEVRAHNTSVGEGGKHIHKRKRDVDDTQMRERDGRLRKERKEEKKKNDPSGERKTHVRGTSMKTRNTSEGE